MSDDAIVQLVLGLIGASGIGGLFKIWLDRKQVPPTLPPPPEPKAEQMAADGADGLVALASALDAIGRKYDALEARVVRCSVPDCPVRTAQFADPHPEESS